MQYPVFPRVWVGLLLCVLMFSLTPSFADIRLPLHVVKARQQMQQQHTQPFQQVAQPDFGERSQESSQSWLQMIALPFRVLSGAAGAGLGIVAGGLQGIVETEQAFATQTFGHASENLAMIPVGIIGSALAVPVGFVLGAPTGAVDWATRGFNLWNLSNRVG